MVMEAHLQKPDGCSLTAVDAVNKIRERAGVDDVASKTPAH